MSDPAQHRRSPASFHCETSVQELRLRTLTFYHNGIERRLTDVHGHVIEELLA